MKCKRCGGKAEVALRAHNAAFCRPCYIGFFQRQVERAIDGARMFTIQERLLLAVSGGKDSLALWDVLVELGYDVTGFYLAQGIGEYSQLSRTKVEAFATSRGLRLEIGDLEAEGPGLAVPDVAKLTRRPSCSACGTLKRYTFDRAAHAGGFDVLVTGHNLDDEAARLMGNVLRWQTDHLARQRPVLEATHEKFVRKVKPLYLLSEYETAVYAFMRGIDYVVDECPNAVGASQLVYKDVLNRLEHESPGTKQSFVREFVKRVQPALAEPASADHTDPNACVRCGMPAWGDLCGFCRLVDEVTTKRARRAAAPPVA